MYINTYNMCTYICMYVHLYKHAYLCIRTQVAKSSQLRPVLSTAVGHAPSKKESQKSARSLFNIYKANS